MAARPRASLTTAPAARGRLLACLPGDHPWLDRFASGVRRQHQIATGPSPKFGIESQVFSPDMVPRAQISVSRLEAIRRPANPVNPRASEAPMLSSASQNLALRKTLKRCSV